MSLVPARGRRRRPRGDRPRDRAAAGSCSGPKSRRSSRSSPPRPARRTPSASAPAPTRIALILRALGIGAGDEVITTPLSAAYTALAIMMAGARPVFADIDPVRLTLDPAARRSAPSARARARSCRCTSTARRRTWRRIERIAARHSLAIVEDCCQAHLATAGGRPVGTIGVAGAFSFYPTKNLGALGDGGAVVTNDRALAERLKRLRNGGQTDRYHHAGAGRQLAARRDAGGDPARAAAVPARLDGAAPRARGALPRGARRRRRSTCRRSCDRRTRLSSVRRAQPRAARSAGAPRRARHRDADSLSRADSAAAGARRRSIRPTARSRRARATRCCRCRSIPRLRDDDVDAGRRGAHVERRFSERTTTSASAHHRRSRVHRLASVRSAARPAATRCSILDNLSTGSIDNIAHLKGRPGFEYFIDSVNNEPLLAELIDRSDVVFHFAAAVGVKLIVEQPVHTIETNVHGTEVVLKHANKKKKLVVIASTSEVYGKSEDVPFREDSDLVLGPTPKHRWAYACSKAIDEFLALAYWKERKLPVIIVRSSTPSGRARPASTAW